MPRRMKSGEEPDALLAPMPRRKSPPFPFILEALSPLEPEVKRMFGGFAVYTGDKIVMMLRDSAKEPQDNGVWLVFSETANLADRKLRRELPSLRTITILGGAIKHWLLIPSDGPDFESDAMRACDLLLAHDARIGRVPKSRLAASGKKRAKKS